MNASALRSSWDIVRCIRWREHLVDHVDYPIACRYISKRNVGIVYLHAVVYCEGEWLPVHCGCRHALADVCCRYFTGDNVVGQNIGQCRFTFRSIERSKVNSCINKRLVCWCKDSKWTWSLERRQEFSLNNTCNERIVNTRTLCSSWDVTG